MTLKGYKQTPEHIAKRFASGPPNYKGDRAGIEAGRSRALKAYPQLPPECQGCGAVGKRLDRHHIDGNTLNNDLENIAFLCRKCHMEADGRLETLKANLAQHRIAGVETAAKEKRSRAMCKRGHLLSGDNVYLNSGKRTCRECRKIHKKAFRERRNGASQ